MNQKLKCKLSKRVTIRFSEDELRKIQISFKSTTKKRLSEYLRYVLLEKPVTVYTRDYAKDKILTELIHLKRELNAIGNNLNQSVKRLHNIEKNQEANWWLTGHEKNAQKELEMIEKINFKISQISDKWLHE